MGMNEQVAILRAAAADIEASTVGQDHVVVALDEAHPLTVGPAIAPHTREVQPRA